MNKIDPDVKIILEHMRLAEKNRMATHAIRDFIDEHANEEIEVQGEKKARITFVLEKLFNLGISGNLKANTMYLNRAIGKVPSARRSRRMW